MKRLQDKVAIITGSGAGIGKEIATAFAQEGAKVVIADFDEDALTKTVSELKESNHEALGMKVNVAVEEDVAKMIDGTVAEFGRVDILVNNAGVGDNMEAAVNVKDETWERAMDVNVTGVMRSVG